MTGLRVGLAIGLLNGHHVGIHTLSRGVLDILSVN